MNFNKVILTTDLSENADAALPYGVELAKRSGGTIHLVHVLEDVVYYTNPAATEGMVPVEWMVANRQSHEMRLKQKASELAQKEGVKVVDVMLQGHPATQIVDYANKEKADVVVIATHGRTGFSHFIFGSVAERVVRTCNSPVLSIRPQSMQK